MTTTRTLTDRQLKSICLQRLRGVGMLSVDHQRAMAARLIELLDERATDDRCARSHAEPLLSLVPMGNA